MSDRYLYALRPYYILIIVYLKKDMKIFGNNSKAIHAKKIENLEHSVPCFVCTLIFEKP